MNKTISLEELQELAADAARVLHTSIHTYLDDCHPGQELPALTLTWHNNPSAGLEEVIIFLDDDLYGVAYMDDLGEIEFDGYIVSPRAAVAAALSKLAYWEMLRRMEGLDAPDPDAPDPMAVTRSLCQ